MSRQAYDHVQNKFDIPFESIGLKSLKNVLVSIEVYKMLMPWQNSIESPTKRITVQPPSSQLNRLRVAVLPFASMSPDPNDEYFADGVTEEIIGRLSLVKGLDVIARTSIMNYKNKEKSVQEIGSELKAGTILEGSVRKSRNRIRVTVQLIDSRTEGHLWASNYDDDLEDVLKVQDSIAENVANVLRLKLVKSGTVEARESINREAYIEYLKGLYFLHKFDEQSIRSSIEHFERSFELDSGYAEALASLSMCHLSLGYFVFEPRDIAYPKAKEYAQRAIRLDETIPEAHLSMANVYFYYEGNWKLSETEYQRAIDLNPSFVDAHIFYASYLGDFGRKEEAINHANRALELDPLSAYVEHMVSSSVYCKPTVELYSEALVHIDKALEMDPRNPAIHDDRGRILISLPGRMPEAIREFESAVELSSGSSFSKANLACAYAITGRREEAMSMAEELKHIPEELGRSMLVASIYASLNEKEEALEWLEKAYDERMIIFNPLLSIDPSFSSLWGEPRFDAIVTKLGLVPQKPLKTSLTASYFDTKRIAVLPFANISPDPNDEYFADGMTEELINALSHVMGLRVIARTSVARYRGGAKPISEIGRELGVGSVMEGSVRKAGDRVRVTAQLIDVATEEHLWSENYDRKLDDIFVIQSSIAEMAAEALKTRLAEGEKKKLESGYTGNPKAYDKYLLAKYGKKPFQDYLTKIRYYEEAIELDPRFAEAYASLADYYVVLSGDFIRPKEAFSKASEYLARALELDEGLSSVWIAKGSIAYQYEWDAQKAEKCFKKAIELNPSESAAYAKYTALCLSTARYEEALQLALKERSLNPYPPYPSELLGLCYSFLKRHDAVMRELDRLTELYPDEPNRHSWAGLMYGLLGMSKEAVGELDQLRAKINELRDQGVKGWTASVWPGFYALCILNYAAMGKVSQVKSVIAQAEEAARSEHVGLSVLGTLYLAAGDREKALDFLERAFDERDSAMFMYHTTLMQLLKHIPELYDLVNSDARFTSLFERVGIHE